MPPPPPSPDTVAAVVLAGGRGRRYAERAGGAVGNKVLLQVAGAPVLVHAVRAFVDHPEVGRTLVVAHADEVGEVTALLAAALPGARVPVVAGGDERADSERCAFEALRPRVEDGTVTTVLVHDGARPVVRPALVSVVLAAARADGGAVPGLPVGGLVHDDGRPLRGTVVRVQTPQGFDARTVLAAYDDARHDGYVGTDTASYVERAGRPVRVVPGDPDNLKVTWPGDLVAVARLLGG